MSDRRCPECGNPFGRAHSCWQCDEEPQDAAPVFKPTADEQSSAEAATRKDAGAGAASCDSELEAIKRRYRNNEWLDGADVDALLRTVDELREESDRAVAALELLGAAKETVEKELRAKLAEATCARNRQWNCATVFEEQKKQLEEKLAEADREIAVVSQKLSVQRTLTEAAEARVKELEAEVSRLRSELDNVYLGRR